MTRILSVFQKSLKRVGFALLLYTSMASAQPVWQEIYNTDEELPFCRIYRIFFATPDSGFMGGHCPYTLFRTIDGGESWTPLWEMSGEGLNGVSELLFRDSRQGIITFSDAVALTFNGGDTWDYIENSFGVPFLVYLDSATLISAGSILASPEAPWTAQIRKSIDAGYTWELMFERDYGFLDGLVGETVLSASGTLLVSRDLLHALRSIDQGDSWEEIEGTQISQTRSGASPDSAVFVFCGNRLRAGPSDTYPAISRSVDDGLTWELVWADSSDEAQGAIEYMSFGDSLHGWASDHDNVVLFTADGGVTWTRDTLELDPGPDIALVRDIYFLREDLGWLVTAGVQNPSRVIRYADTMANGVGDASVVTVDPLQIVSAYPNPFNSEIAFDIQVLPTVQMVILDIYDILGRRIESINLPAAALSRTLVNWKPTDIASGTYVLRLTSSTHTSKPITVKYLK